MGKRIEAHALMKNRNMTSGVLVQSIGDTFQIAEEMSQGSSRRQGQARCASPAWIPPDILCLVREELKIAHRRTKKSSIWRDKDEDENDQYRLDQMVG